MSDSSYGVFGQINSNANMTLGSYHTGNATSAASVPTNVTATYNGTFAGYELHTGRDLTNNNMGTLIGDTEVVANFSEGTVTGSVSNLRYEGLESSTDQAAGYGISMNGKITGNLYAGTAGFTNSSGAAAGSVSRSNLNGAFYGAGAAETAGAVTIEGRTPGSRATNAAVIGAFGAKK